MEIRFDTYYTYADLTERLAWLAAQYPGIMQLNALGKSHEGREIPLVILTNTATGPDTEKPAFWIDANIHATELTASMAALYFIKKTVEGYGNDTKITRILDEQAVYVVPRLNPDGAELALAAKQTDRPVATRHLLFAICCLPPPSPHGIIPSCR
jgi:murein tripeptide amidase MpaA